MQRIKKGDEVIVISGKDKGRRGRVMTMRTDGRVLVENVNLVKKHVKPNPNVGEQGGIKEKEMPLQLSNVLLFNPATNKGERVGFKVLEDGRKVRVFKSTGEQVDG